MISLRRQDITLDPAPISVHFQQAEGNLCTGINYCQAQAHSPNRYGTRQGRSNVRSVLHTTFYQGDLPYSQDTLTARSIPILVEVQSNVPRGRQQCSLEMP